jgi:Ser/Thr protein kinase RdoA (MazF antagonist)
MESFDDLSPEGQLERIGELAQDALGAYELPADARVSLINYSENMTYRVDAPASGGRWALRVHREDYHTKNGIGCELAWMKALREEAGVPTPIALAGKDGELIQDVSSTGVPRPRHCVLFDWLAGHEPDESGDLVGPFEELGEISARLHKHSKGWARPDNFERLVWVYDHMLGDKPYWGRWQDGMGLDPEKIALFERLSTAIARRLEAYGQGPERFGVIHADLRLANLLVDETGTRVIDFDDCGLGWFMYDLGTALSFIEHRPEVPEWVAAWVAGYRKVLDLAQADEDEIPTFILLRRLLLVAWIGSHSATELAQEMGVDYTNDTVALAENYLAKFG